MYLVWQLPDDVFANVANRLLVKELDTWSDRFQTPYNTKIFKGTRRVTFDNDAFYSLFVMTWPRFETAPSLSKWRLISDPNNKT